MTLTTNPSTVSRGRCAVSATSSRKRMALIGRTVRHTIQPEADPASARIVSAVITEISNGYPLATVVAPAERLADGTSDLIGSRVRLGSVVFLLNCQSCRYTAGHTSWCPNRDAERAATDLRLSRKA